MNKGTELSSNCRNKKLHPSNKEIQIQVYQLAQDSNPLGRKDASKSFLLETIDGDFVCFVLFYMYALGKCTSGKLAQKKLILWAGIV